MASRKIEALKVELTKSLSRSTVDRDELSKKIEDAIILEVAGDLGRKVDALRSGYTYCNAESRADRLEILVDACSDFVLFAHEIRQGKVIMLTAGEADGAV